MIEKKNNILVITYLIYIIFYETLTIAGSCYIVLELNRSKWWLLLGLILSACCISTHKWYSLIDGIKRKDSLED